jgi:hypothetical protein
MPTYLVVEHIIRHLMFKDNTAWYIFECHV